MLSVNQGYSQERMYLDLAGSTIRKKESKAASVAFEKMQQTQAASNRINTISKYETTARSKFIPTLRKIDFSKYSKACHNIRNLERRQKRLEEIQYLRSAYQLINNVIKVNPMFEMRNGDQELIMQKYNSIVNMLVSRLEHIESLPK